MHYIADGYLSLHWKPYNIDTVIWPVICHFVDTWSFVWPIVGETASSTDAAFILLISSAVMLSVSFLETGVFSFYDVEALFCCSQYIYYYSLVIEVFVETDCLCD